MNRDETLRALEEGHSRLTQALAGFSDQVMGTRPLTGDWTGTDLLAHVARWENTCADYLAEVAAGRPISRLPGTSEQLNAGYYDADRSLSLDQARAAESASFGRVRSAVLGLSDEQLNLKMRGPWPEIPEELPLWRIIAIDTWDHYQMHLKDF